MPGREVCYNWPGHIQTKGYKSNVKFKTSRIPLNPCMKDKKQFHEETEDRSFVINVFLYRCNKIPVLS